MLKCLHRCCDKSIPNKPKTTFLIDTDIETTPHVYTLRVHRMYVLYVHYMYVH